MQFNKVTMKQKLINLQTSSYEHPFDKAALEKVNAIPMLPKIVNFVMNWTVIKWKIVSMCGSNFHVTKGACPDLAELSNEVFDILDLDKHPELYMEQDYYINAYTTGHQKDAFIVLSTGSVDRLDDGELQFVIGHEAGHIKSNHVLYHLMTAYLAQIVSAIPGASTVSLPLQTALWYWNRMSEFTADRAGLLACQDLNAALSAIMKMSGLPLKYYDTASVEGFMQQAREFDKKYGGTTDKIIKTLTIFDEDHPWTIVRASELIKWYESGEYERILNGTKPKICPVCGQALPLSATSCPVCGNTKF